MSDTLLDALRRTRKGYEEECAWHKFLMDAYLGTGGFEGAIKQPPSGHWGPASEAYSNVVTSTRGYDTPDTYLDRYPREDLPKFRARINATAYYNYIEPLTDLKISHLLRKPFERRDVPEVIEEWHNDIDGQGTTWDEFRATLASMSGVLGWFPLAVDVKPAPTDDEGNPLDLNRAQAAEFGLQPYPVPLFPSQLLDYDLDDSGNFVFAKTRVDSMRRDTWDQDPYKVETYTIWTADEWRKYEVTDTQGQSAAVLIAEGRNPFGAVPIVPVRCKPSMDDPIKGSALHAAASKVARALYNRTSEYTEHLRGQVFAVLVYASKGGVVPEDISLGTDNALVVDADGSQTHEFLAPPASVAETYEKRLESDVREIYRLARVEFTRQGGQTASGLARAYEFAQTNRALADFAREIAKAEQAVDDLVGRYYDVPFEERAAAQVIPPQSFDVEDLQTDIQAGLDLITAQIGPTATKLVKMQLIEQRLRNLPPDTIDIIESELDDAAALDAAIDRFDDPGPIVVGSPESEAEDDATLDPLVEP